MFPLSSVQSKIGGGKLLWRFPTLRRFRVANRHCAAFAQGSGVVIRKFFCNAPPWCEARWRLKGERRSMLNKKPLFYIALAGLLSATLIRSQQCTSNQYKAPKTGICCNLCPRGRFLTKQCQLPGTNSFCDACPSEYYTAIENFSEKCHKCTPCESDEVEYSSCLPSSNRVCVCKKGYYKPEGSFFCIEETSTSISSTTSGFKDPEGPKLAIISSVTIISIILVLAAAAVGYFLCVNKRWPCANIPLITDESIPLDSVGIPSHSNQDDNKVNNRRSQPVPRGNGPSAQASAPTDYAKYEIPVTEKDLLEIDKIRQQCSGVKFVTVMRIAGLTDNEIQAIRQNYRDDVEEQDHQMLLKWLQKKGREATFAVLLKAMDEGGFQKFKEDCQKKCDEIIVRRDLLESVPSDSNDVTSEDTFLKQTEAEDK